MLYKYIFSPGFGVGVGVGRAQKGINKITKKELKSNKTQILNS